MSTNNSDIFKEGRQWRTLSLFADVALSSSKQEEFLAKLGEMDDEGRRNYFLYNLETPRRGFEHLPILKELFFETCDPSGSELANRYLGGHRHFEILTKNVPWFREAFTRWQEEFAVYHKARALRQIINIANNPDHRNNYHASKYILEEDWVSSVLDAMGKQRDKTKRGPGRPKKEKVAEEVALSTDVREAMNRLGLNVIEGTNE